jgi:hypothetical protein
MLQSAAAASAEMGAWRRDPIGTGRQHGVKLAPVLVNSCANAFPRQGERDKNRTGSDPISLRPDAVDQDIDLS